MAVTNIVYNKGRGQWQGIYSDMWTVKYAESANVAPTTGTNALSVVAVPGVLFGDIVLNVSVSVDQASMVIDGYVSAADTVTIVYSNNTAGTITLTTPTVKFVVVRPNF